MNNFLGIDIGGTNVSYAIVNDEHEFLFEGNLKTKDVESVSELAEKIFKDVTKSKIEISGVGIGAPSVNQLTENIEFAPNLDWGDIIPVKEAFSKVFSQEIAVMNDANAAAIGEKHYGGAKELENFAVVTLGTGVGLGIYMNGRIILGQNGLAGELGHVVVHRDGRECNCGNFGCLETYIGKNGIIRTAKEKLEFSSGGSMLNKILPSELNPEEIFKAARKEDPVALEVMDLVSSDLGYVLSCLTNIIDIENIFLSGGISKSGNLLRRKTEKHMKVNVLPNLRDKVHIKVSELNTKNGAILGAAASAKEKLETAQ